MKFSHLISLFLWCIVFFWYRRWSLIFCFSHNVRFVTDHYLNFVAFQLRVYYHTGYTPFCFFPSSLSASCNLILLRTGAPPPRQLTFPLIHSKVPQGENNCTPVYSHYMVFAGLIQLIKVATVNQLTDLGPYPFCCLFYSLAVITVVDCVVGNGLRSGKEGERSVLSLPRLDKFSLCCSSAHQQYLIVCFFSVSSWHGDVATVWILSTACYSQFKNALWLTVSAFYKMWTLSCVLTKLHAWRDTAYSSLSP